MFPLSDVEKTNRFPIITVAIIALNIYAFILTITSSNPDLFISQYALIPQNINFLDYNTLLPFITSMFLHAGFFHIFSNMWFLHIFGDNVEEKLGVVTYLFLYLFTGIVGGLAQYILQSSSQIPMIGASGAVSGILGAYLVFFPHHRIRSVVFVFFIFTIINIPAGFYLFYWFLIQFFQGVASIPTLSVETGGVAFMAHVGGFASGYLLAKMLKGNEEKEFIEGEVIE